MKRVLALIALAVLTSTAVAQTQAEKDKALKYLESTKQGVIDATKGLSAAQWNFKPGPDRWSVAEVMEHIAAAEDFIRGNITNNVMKAPARTENVDLAALDAVVIARIPDRSVKAQAPEPLKPTNRFGSPEAALKHFLESRQTTEDFLASHGDLREHATDSPMGRKLDAYEWVLFLTAHSERHTKQILEVKADPNFPKM
jgi:uncharacterized damage-inducible protein DinB